MGRTRSLKDPRENPTPWTAVGRKHPQHGWQTWVRGYEMWVTSVRHDAGNAEAEELWSTHLTYEDTWAEPEE